MTDDQKRNEEYLKQRLEHLGAKDLKIDQSAKEYEIHTFIGDFKFLITTDLLTTFEVEINNYFKELTDYLNGDFKETIDWYMDVIEQIIKREYSLIRYTRKGKEICRYIQLKDGQLIGDYQNHFKVFAKKESIPAGNI